jgi:hypothetical protein
VVTDYVLIAVDTVPGSRRPSVRPWRVTSTRRSDPQTRCRHPEDPPHPSEENAAFATHQSQQLQRLRLQGWSIGTRKPLDAGAADITLELV